MTDTMEQGEGCGEKFTPGPWTLHLDHRIGYDRMVPTWYVRGANKVGVAIQPAFSDENASEADFRLIASAPELYEALSHLTDLFVSLAPLGDDTEREIAVINARAALLKASGGKDV